MSFMSCQKTKDELRVERSIENLIRKFELRDTSALLLAQSEKRLEEYCERNGLIYFPSKLYCQIF